MSDYLDSVRKQPEHRQFDAAQSAEYMRGSNPIRDCVRAGTGNTIRPDFPPPALGYFEQRQPGINGFAIASFVCSLSWGYGFLSVLGIVFALVARHQISAHSDAGHDQPGNNFAIAGLVIGIVGAVVTPIIVLIMLAASAG